MIKSKFLSTINEYKMFEPGELVVVAVSGGPDSVALLNLLDGYKKEIGITLHVAHLNHLIRRGDAELDVKFVEGLAQKLGIPVTVEAVDVPALAEQERIGLEEAARLARYDFFARTAAKLGA